MAVVKSFGFQESCVCWEMIIEINDLILLYHRSYEHQCYFQLICFSLFNFKAYSEIKSDATVHMELLTVLL